jgi:hypothetical protein
VGTQFCGPKATSALSRVVTDDEERERLLAEAGKLLSQGTVGHNHLWFYRDAIEAMLVAGDTPGVFRYATALESYTAAEPLPWSQLFVARGRALASAMHLAYASKAMKLRDQREKQSFSTVSAHLGHQ